MYSSCYWHDQSLYYRCLVILLLRRLLSHAITPIRVYSHAKIYKVSHYNTDPFNHRNIDMCIIVVLISTRLLSHAIIPTCVVTQISTRLVVMTPTPLITIILTCLVTLILTRLLSHTRIPMNLHDNTNMCMVTPRSIWFATIIPTPLITIISTVFSHPDTDTVT